MGNKCIISKPVNKKSSSSPKLNRKKVTHQGKYYLGAKIKGVDVGGQTGYFTSKEKIYERENDLSVVKE